MKNLICLLALAVLSVLLTGCGTDAPPETTTAVEMPQPSENPEDFSLEQLEAFTGGNVSIRYSPDTGMPKEITGKFSSHGIFSAEDAVAALGSVKTLFGIEELNFVCTQVDERTDATVYWLDQLWQGIPVSGYGFRVEAGADGAAQFVSGSYLQGISVDVSGALAAESCTAALELYPGEQIAASRQVILEEKGQVVLCWEFHIVGADPLMERLVFCDALTGEPVKTRMMAMS